MSGLYSDCNDGESIQIDTRCFLLITNCIATYYKELIYFSLDTSDNKLLSKLVYSYLPFLVDFYLPITPATICICSNTYFCPKVKPIENSYNMYLLEYLRYNLLCAVGVSAMFLFYFRALNQFYLYLKRLND